MTTNDQTPQANYGALDAAMKVLQHEQIAERAYHIWMKRGRPAGEDEQIWYEAEEQLKSELGLD